MGTDLVISFFQWLIIIVHEINFEAEPFLKCFVDNGTIDLGGKSQSITVLNRIERNEMKFLLLL
jgi:hypothetical protein